MLDVLEIVVPQRAVRVPRLEQDVGPVGGGGIVEEQEGLPANGPAPGKTRAAGPVELDGPLEIGKAGAGLERLVPPAPDMCVRPGPGY